MVRDAVTPPFPPDVCVAIVSHNNRDKLGPALASLDAGGCPHAVIRVIDVASTDGTSEWLRDAYPAVTVTRLSENHGPDPARNIGILEAPLPYVYLMDADIILRPNTIQRLREVMATDAAIKCGSSIVVHASAPDRIQYAGGSLHFICEAINPWMDRPLAERGTGVHDVDVAPTCGLLLEKQASIDIGLLDERYFIGKEDGDFTHRFRVAGYRIAEPADALVLHHSRPRSSWLFYFQIRNRWHFMLKNYQWRTLIGVLPCLLVHETLQAALLHLKGHAKVYWKAVFGLIAMLPDLPRDRAVTNRIRKVRDADLLLAGSLIVRADLAGGTLARVGKGAYEAFLRGYWWLLTRTLLAL